MQPRIIESISLFLLNNSTRYCWAIFEIMSLFLLIHPSSTSGTNNGHAIEFNLTEFVFELNAFS